MIKEFREFILRGNVLDLAIGIIIGAAFTAIVSSLVADVINPILGLILAGIDFSDIIITLRAAEGENPAVTINLGLFINAVIQFLITAFVVFLIVKSFNEMSRRFSREKAEEAAPPPGPSVDERILTTLENIDDTLKKIENKPNM